MTRITLLTDFGTRDGYVGAMKGVLAAATSGVHVDDISHAVAPGDVRGASYALARYWDRYPRGTVHVAVVDPGVGTRRRAMAVQVDGRSLVLPDNGLATWVLARASGWEAAIIDPDRVGATRPSATFHGRDLFAPAAAILANGEPVASLGPRLQDPVRLEEPAPTEREGRLQGEVVTVDRFGNLITNVPGERLPDEVVIRLEGRRIPFVLTYGEGEEGELLALVNSDGRLEVAVREGSAAEALGVSRGAVVEVE